MEKLKRWTTKQLSRLTAAFVAFPAVVIFGFFAVLVRSLSYNPHASATFPYRALFLALLAAAGGSLLFSLVVRRFSLGLGWQLALTGMGILPACAVFLVLYMLPDRTGLWQARSFVMIASLFLICLLLLDLPGRGLGPVLFELVRALVGSLPFAGGLLVLTEGTVCLVGLLRRQAISAPLLRAALLLSIFVSALFAVGALAGVFEEKEPSEPPEYRRGAERIVSYLLIPAEMAFFAFELVQFGRAYIYENWPPATESFTRLLVLLSCGFFIYLLSTRFTTRLCVFFRVFFPCAGLLALAVSIWRLVLLCSRYGLTESRYFAAVCYLFFSVSLLVLLLRQEGKGSIILTLAILLSVLSVLPIINYHTVSAFSQMRRAETIMERNGMLHETTVSPPESISESDRLELSRSVQYLVDHDETAMARWLPLNFDFYEDYRAVFGVAGEYDETGQSTLTSRAVAGILADKAYSVAGADWMLTNFTTYSLPGFSAENLSGQKGSYSVRFVQAAGESLIALVWRDGDLLAETDLTERLAEIARYLSEHAPADGSPVPMPLEQMTLTVPLAGGGKVCVVLKSVTVPADGAQRGLSSALTDSIWIQE